MHHILGNRGSGNTTRQIERAPHGAYYVWMNTQTSYVVSLAIHLGRKDLKIISASMLQEPAKFRGLGRVDIVVDHAVELTYKQLFGLDYVRDSCR